MIKRFEFLTIVFLFCLLVTQAFSQPVIGEWTDYQSYASARNVVDAGSKIYCVTSGGLFSYNKDDNSIQKMSGINGLSDSGVGRLAYNAKKNVLLIAYQNTNIDLLVGNQIFNISDIKRKQLSANKTINDVLFVDNLAYLSCGFGIVVVNLDKKEIKETYFIGADGGYLNVFDLDTDGNFLYAATESGIYKADVKNSNLQDYNSWVREETLPKFNKKFSKIENFNGKIIANYTTDNDSWDGDRLYSLEGDSWVPFLTNISYVSDITNNGNYLVISCREEVFVFDKQFVQVKHLPKQLYEDQSKTLNSKCAVIDAANVIWVADLNNGLVKVGTQIEKIIPDGPIDNMIFSMTMNGSDLWIASGGSTASWGNLYKLPQFQLYRDGKWKVFDRSVFPILNDFRDIVCITVDPNNPDHIYAGSWGGGVLEFNGNELVKQYNNFNSSLQTALPAQPEDPYVRVGGMEYDSKGNLWMSNSDVASNLSVLKKDGSWEAFEISEIANKYSIGKVIVTEDDDKWLLIPRGKGQSVAVMNSTNSDSKAQKVIARFSNSEGDFFNEMSDVYSMAEDKNGEIWIGTSGGVAVYSNPSAIWTENFLYATRPGLDLKDKFFHPLLENETVTAITVDGANRKWFGTKSSGVFLISADGETEIKHFNTENSPLPSNEIMDIAINQKTGEVFIGTGLGLISYMGEATEGDEEFNDVYVYPNPVRETYNGPVVVKGLLEDTDVKITDISGDLVYKTKSLGGQAIWDGKNLNGKRCKTGVYLVFLSNRTGEKTKITKLLFIH